MTKKLPSIEHDQNIVNALNKLPQVIFDKKHNLSLLLNDGKTRSNETRFEHIAKKYHQLKVRDIESIPEGIANYVAFLKSKRIKDTYSYIIKRKGMDKGFIRIDVLIDFNDKTKAYFKTAYIVYRIKEK